MEILDAEARPSPPGAAGSSRPVRWYLPLGVLLLISLALVATSYLVPLLGSHPIYSAEGEIGGWFSVDGEGNVPAWWSTMLLGGAALTHLGGGWLARSTRMRGVAAWMLVGLLLLVMSLDEATQVHEQFDQLGDVVAVPGDFEYVWLIVGIPAAVVVLVVVLASGLRMPRRSLVGLLIGFALFFGGAVGLEIVGSLAVSQGLAQETSVAFHIEEALEMTGASLIAVAPLAGMRTTRDTDAVTLSLAPRLRAGRPGRRRGGRP